MLPPSLLFPRNVRILFSTSSMIVVINKALILNGLVSGFVCLFALVCMGETSTFYFLGLNSSYMSPLSFFFLKIY